MATGFSVMDALNKNSKAGVDESPRARFRTKDISIFKMYRNKLNFYESLPSWERGLKCHLHKYIAICLLCRSPRGRRHPHVWSQTES
mgnify:CR=1 FL=1